MGWVVANLYNIFVWEVSKVNISLLGTILTFILFIFSLKSWSIIRWNKNKILNSLGLFNPILNQEIIKIFKGLLISLILVFLTFSLLFFGGYVTDVNDFNFGKLINAIFLGLFVGFAEELIFRGWLMNEFQYLFGARKGLFIQPLIFSLVHIRFDLSFWEMLFLLFGLFLLGFSLTLIRLRDNGSLWGAISLHGGLVGFWFLVSQAIFEFSSKAPEVIIGPNVSPNPIGGAVGIISFLILIFTQRRTLVRFLRLPEFTVSDSSKEVNP